MSAAARSVAAVALDTLFSSGRTGWAPPGPGVLAWPAGDDMVLAAAVEALPEADALSMAVRMGDFTNVPGGFPIAVAGEVIGAVAAGGAKIEQDVIVAQAALAALGLPDVR